MYHYKVHWGKNWLIENEQEIRDLADDVNKAIHIITDRWKYLFPYSVWPIVVSGGLHERDTGYESFSGGEYPYNRYQPGSWVDDLLSDFREQESKLDGGWFNVLNFEEIIVVIMGYKGPIVLEFQNGQLDVTISYDDHETQDLILQDLKNAFETASK